MREEGKVASGAWGGELGALMLSRERGYAAARMDENGSIQEWSDAAVYVTGWSSGDAIGQPISLIFTPEDRARGLDMHELRAADETGAAEDERWHLRKDGSRFWASGICLPLPGGGYAKIFKDATHLRARSKVLENEVERLSTLLAERDEALAVVAHELRGPLAPVKAAAAALSRGTPRPEDGKALAIIGRQLEAMERLVEDLVDASRARAGKLSLAYRKAELGAVCREALSGFESPARAKGVELRSALPGANIEIEVDPGRMQQALSNLLSNALKFTPPGGWVALSATVDASHFLVAVRDSGAGIAPDLLPTIFDMFTQAGGAASGRGAGLGVGLAVAKEIAALHGGSIEVRSAGLGKGAEFILRIPVAPRVAPPAAASEAART